MRARLLDSAIIIVASQGPAAASIDDVVAGAEVSRGTFYKYFDSPATLLKALGAEVSGELIQLADTLVLAHTDPAERLAAGLRAILHLVRLHPALGWFIARAGWPLVERAQLFFQPVARDLAAGLQQGRFARMHIEVAINLVTGTAVGAVHTLSTQRMPKDFSEQVTAALLRGLGLGGNEAARICALKLPAPQLPEDTLLGRFIAAQPT